MVCEAIEEIGRVSPARRKLEGKYFNRKDRKGRPRSTRYFYSMIENVELQASDYVRAIKLTTHEELKEILDQIKPIYQSVLQQEVHMGMQVT